MNANEKWRAIADYEDLYEVSDQGRVRRLAFSNGYGNHPCAVPIVLTPKHDAGGYPMVGLSRHKRKKYMAIHRLVLFAFRGPPPEGMECAHENGNRKDARLVNLSWKTVSDNHMDKRRHGTDLRGEKAPWAILTNEDAVAIRAAFSGGASVREIAARYPVHYNQVYKCIIGATFCTAGGQTVVSTRKRCRTLA